MYSRSVLAIHGLYRRSMDCTGQSIDCPGQSMDCPNLSYAHNIYTEIHMLYHRVL